MGVVLKKIIDFLQNKVLNSIFDSIYKRIGEKVWKVNFEKILKRIIVALVCCCIVSAVWASLSYGKYIIAIGIVSSESVQSKTKMPDLDSNGTATEEEQATENESPEEGTDYTITTETTVSIIKQARLSLAFCAISIIFIVVLWILLMLLKIEKKSHQEVIDEEKRRAQLEIIKQPNRLLEITNKYERKTLIPETWDIASLGNKEEDQKKLLEMYNLMLIQIQNAYKELCLFVIYRIYPHIQEKNKQDTVHVSIKALYDQDGSSNIDNMGIISLGSVDWKSGERVPISQPFDIHKPTEIFDNNHTLAEDFALREVFKSEGETRVFRQANLEAFIKAQETTHADRKYSKPAYVNREYNATMICPLACIDEGNLNSFGAICIDTTSSYADWNKEGSFEEELITYIASVAGPMLGHNFAEMELANKIVGEKIIAGGKKYGKGRV